MLEKEAKIKSDYNIVVFIGTDISGVSCDNIYSIDEFEEILLDIMDDEDKYTLEECERIYNTIIKNKSTVTIEEHRENIKRKYGE